MKVWDYFLDDTGGIVGWQEGTSRTRPDLAGSPQPLPEMKSLKDEYGNPLWELMYDENEEPIGIKKRKVTPTAEQMAAKTRDEKRQKLTAALADKLLDIVEGDENIGTLVTQLKAVLRE